MLFHIGMNDEKFPAHPMNLWSFQKDPLGQSEEKMDNEVLLLWLNCLLNLTPWVSVKDKAYTSYVLNIS